jgi:hypothetical protein
MIDISRPNNARVYSYLLGGKDNYAADREAAETVLERDPGLRRRARLNRAFVTGATKRAARAGITQFIDLGCGLPVHPSVDEVVRLAHPLARVAYVDTDPVVYSHVNAIAAVEEGTAAVLADIRDANVVLEDPCLTSVIDMTKPVCLLLTAVAQLLPTQEVAELTAGYIHAMPAGSWLVLSTEHVPDAAMHPPLARLYGTGQFHNHSPDDVARFLRGLDLVDPGIAEARRWLSVIAAGAPDRDAPSYVLCAAGTKPAAPPRPGNC